MPQPVLRVTVELPAQPPTQPTERDFSATFQIGRLPDCELCIDHDEVSRRHAQVVLEAGVWKLLDLGSANGTLVEGRRVESLTIHQAVTVRLGPAGPSITLEPIAKPAELASYIDRYFVTGTPDQPVGEHTRMIRKAFAEVRNKQKRKYGGVVAALGLLIVAFGGYALWIHQQTKDQIGLARTLFYNIKALEIDIASLEKLLEGNAQSQVRIRAMQQRRDEMRRDYQRFLTAVRASDSRMSPKERLIVRVARIFGECELELPSGFVREVETYIAKWKSSGRLATAIHTAVEQRYVDRIASELLARQLPPQFFYLALQESNFDPFISGPPTRFGIAKGMWQFIPQTGQEYGLRIGPLAEFPRPDTRDDRHDWQKSTRAAAHYLQDLYSTEAQASGFLVMACYNWGEGQVLPLVRRLPNNPRDRNFWRLLAAHRDKLPQETYDYVFYIISAAAIGEDPGLFGFSFRNPLAHLQAP